MIYDATVDHAVDSFQSSAANFTTKGKIFYANSPFMPNLVEIRVHCIVILLHD